MSDINDNEISSTLEEKKIDDDMVDVDSNHSPIHHVSSAVASEHYLSSFSSCRSVDCYKKLNSIDEGTYGFVYRAQDTETGEIYALKRIKMDKQVEGFPLTSLREVTLLMEFPHPNVVGIREMVVGSTVDRIFMVMEYVEHDLKALMGAMQQPFLASEVKCLIQQLLAGVQHLHANWVLHRDLKTSNLLYSNRGELKIADFGLARHYGSPLQGFTQPVVTLWYRAPELLLGIKQYSTAIDMWSVGCIFAEIIAGTTLFPAQSELDLLHKMFELLGTPNERIWPGIRELSSFQKFKFFVQPDNMLRIKFPSITDLAFDLLNRCMYYDPEQRIKADEALAHEYFLEQPAPKDPALMPTWPETNAS